MNRGMKAMLGHCARWFRAGSSHWQFLVLMSSLSLNTKYLRSYLWPPNWDRRSEWWAIWGAFGGGSGSTSRVRAAHCANSDTTSICGSLAFVDFCVLVTLISGWDVVNTEQCISLWLSDWVVSSWLFFGYFWPVCLFGCLSIWLEFVLRRLWWFTDCDDVMNESFWLLNWVDNSWLLIWCVTRLVLDYSRRSDTALTINIL